MLSQLSSAAMGVVEFFLPRICHICLERLAPGDEVICDRCRSQLLPVEGPVCPRCGYGPARIEEGRCPACPKPAHFDMARGAVRFGDTSRDLIHELKFYGHVELGPVMARRCFRLLEEEWAFEAPDMIVPVPLHESRRRERGFNQAEEIGAELERLARVPMAPAALERIRPTRVQSTLSRAERRENVRGAFYCDPSSGVAGRTVLLLDDVMTSSATVNECSRVLKDAGAARVLVLVFARAGGG